MMVLTPAVGQADGLSLSVDAPTDVTMPDGALLHMTVGGSPSEGGVAVAVFDDYWNLVGSCGVDDGECDYLALPYLQGGGSHSVIAHFNIQAVGMNVSSPVVQTTVTYDPPDWQVAFTMPRAVTMPERIPLSFATMPALDSGHSVELFDADSNQYADFSCPTQSFCDGSIGTGWLGGVPVTKTYRAQLKDGSTTMASVTRAVTIFPPNIGLTIVVPPFVLPGHTFTIKVTNIYNQWTPYTIEVRDQDGNLVGSCAVDATTCEFTLTAGAEGTDQSFTAGVKSGSVIVSSTSPVKVEATDPATAGSNDGIDISALAALFGSASSVCESLLYYAGTHVTNTSTSDEEDACLVASEASGATTESVIRAALLALAAAGGAATGQSLLAWLQHYAWENWGTTTVSPRPPPAHPTDPPTSTPAPVGSAAADIADALIAKNAAIATLGATAALTIARACLNLTGDQGLSSDLCKTRPIFLPGSDYPTATNHRIAAIASWPAWVRLHRRFGPRTGWHLSQTECQDVPTGNHCDEFPEQRTYEGGNPAGTTKHRPSLDKYVTEADNVGLGGKFGVFLGKRAVPTGCKIPDDGEFLVVPLPPVLGIPTQTSVCNFPIPIP